VARNQRLYPLALLACAAFLPACGDSTPGANETDPTEATGPTEGTDQSSGTEGTSADQTSTADETGVDMGLCSGDPLDLERPEHWTRESHCKGEPADYDRLFDDDAVQRIDITIAAADADAMDDDLSEMLGPFGGGGMMPPPMSDEDPIYVPVRIDYEGQVWEQVGMRYKGNSSLRFSWQQGVPKLSFRLNFDKFADNIAETNDQRFWGFRKMTFASSYMDPSFLRDKISAEIFRDAGVPAAHSSFIELWVDRGEGPTYWGVYVMIEDVSDELIQTQYNEGGNLYKPEGMGADFTTFNADAFPKKTNEEAGDWSDVQGAISALHADPSDAAAWREGLEEAFDVPTFLRWLAVNQTLHNWDTYGVAPHNYYIYADPDDGGRLTWIPWDLNLTFYPGTAGHMALSVLLDEVGDNWPLIRLLLDDPVYGQLYLDELDRTVHEVLDPAALEAKLNAYHDMLDPYVQAEEAPYTQLMNYGEFADSLYDAPYALVPYLSERIAVVESVL